MDKCTLSEKDLPQYEFKDLIAQDMFSYTPSFSEIAGFQFAINTLDKYESIVKESAKYPDMGSLQGASFLAHGLAGEVGNVNDTIKNLYYDQCEGKPVRTDENQEKVLRVLGKTLWYLVMLAHEVGASLDKVIEINTKDIQEEE